MRKVLLSPSSFGAISKEPIDLLLNNNFSIVENPYGRKLSDSELLELGKECSAIIAGLENLNKKNIDRLPHLKCISRVGVGMDSVDVSHAHSKGIKVFNTPNGPTRAVAELTLGLTMCLLRKIPQAHYDLKNKVWKKQTGNLLINKKIGVFGLGRIGRMTAEIFRSLGNSVNGYDLHPNMKWAHKQRVNVVSLEELLSTSDIITIHVPANSDGSPILTKKELELLKNEAFIVNVSRGGVIDELALYEILKKGKLSGVALDVFSQEPYRGQLCDLENIILTPHIGSYAKEGKLKMEIDAVMNLINSLKQDD